MGIRERCRVGIGVEIRESCRVGIGVGIRISGGWELGW